MKRLTSHLYFWVLTAIGVGIILGAVAPTFAVSLRPLGDGFIALVKMLIPPIIFCTVVLGIAGAGDMKKVGRVGVKTLIYFEVVTTLALAIGLVVVNTIRPGAGFNADPATLDAAAVQSFAQTAATQTTTQFILHIIPATFLRAFTDGDILQVLFVSILTGYAITKLGKSHGTVHRMIEDVSHIFFAIMNACMKLAPIGAMGAMAFTIGRYGIDSLGPLAALLGSYYLTCILFVVVVLGGICALAGFNLFKLILYIKDELLTVLGTASSESAMVPVMQKLEKLGCSRAVVGLVIPSGMSFNMDGTSIYITMAAGLRGPGAQHRAHPDAADHAAAGGGGDLQGRGGDRGGGLRHAGGHAGSGSVDPGGGARADPGRRPLHGRDALHHELHRQRGGHHRGVALGGGDRHELPARGARRPAARSRRRRPSGDCRGECPGGRSGVGDAGIDGPAAMTAAGHDES